MACSPRKVKKKKESSPPVSLWCDFRSRGAVGTTLRGSGKPHVARRLPGIFSIACSARKKCSSSPRKGARTASYGAAGSCSAVTALSLIGVIGCLHLLFKKRLMHGCSSCHSCLSFCLSLSVSPYFFLSLSQISATIKV